jgi:hypothetical protein
MPDWVWIKKYIGRSFVWYGDQQSIFMTCDAGVVVVLPKNLVHRQRHHTGAHEG